MAAALVILAVATILVTPDPADDVLGVLHKHHLMHVAPVFAGVLQPVLLLASFLPAGLASRRSESADLFDLICVRLC
ncbi:MAG TPA: hypothetical protein VGF06_05490 [Terriglobales bacterium]|jgi:hypothetical protein